MPALDSMHPPSRNPRQPRAGALPRRHAHPVALSTPSHAAGLRCCLHRCCPRLRHCLPSLPPLQLPALLLRLLPLPLPLPALLLLPLPLPLPALLLLPPPPQRTRQGRRAAASGVACSSRIPVGRPAVQQWAAVRHAL